MSKKTLILSTLAGNCMDDQGAVGLSEALKFNKSLTELNLSRETSFFFRPCLKDFNFTLFYRERYQRPRCKVIW